MTNLIATSLLYSKVNLSLSNSSFSNLSHQKYRTYVVHITIMGQLIWFFLISSPCVTSQAQVLFIKRIYSILGLIKSNTRWVGQLFWRLVDQDLSIILFYWVVKNLLHYLGILNPPWWKLRPRSWTSFFTANFNSTTPHHHLSRKGWSACVVWTNIR